MARSTNRGVVLLILAMLGGALWFRFRGGHVETPIDAPQPVPVDAHVRAAVIDAATEPDPVVDPPTAVPVIASTNWQLRLSSDGKHALLSAGQSQAGEPIAYR